MIAKEKFKPDFFLYENNKSAAKPIKEQISHELGVDLMYINSALVSAQNRQRFYAFNWKVEQPEDRGILLRDILETGTDLTQNEKSYCLTARYNGAIAWNTLERAQRTMVAVPINTTADGKAQCIRSTCYKDGIRNLIANDVDKRACVAEAVCVQEQVKGRKANADGTYTRQYEARIDGKSGTLTGTMRQNAVAEPVSISADGKQIYEVKNGFITIKDKQYPIKLADGLYIIRKLTPIECERLQTMPDNYTACVSNSQRYKGLGNGWTAEVIIHILNGALKDIPKDEGIVVLSMYDGIGTGRYCLDKMGFTNVKYYASEIDRYAMKIAKSNYPDITYIGDAFNVRKEDWRLEHYD